MLPEAIPLLATTWHCQSRQPPGLRGGTVRPLKTDVFWLRALSSFHLLWWLWCGVAESLCLACPPSVHQLFLVQRDWLLGLWRQIAPLDAGAHSCMPALIVARLSRSLWRLSSAQCPGLCPRQQVRHQIVGRFRPPLLGGFSAVLALPLRSG